MEVTVGHMADITQEDCKRRCVEVFTAFAAVDLDSRPHYQSVPTTMAERIARMLGPNRDEFDEDLLPDGDDPRGGEVDSNQDEWMQAAAGEYARTRGEPGGEGDGFGRDWGDQHDWIMPSRDGQ